MQQYRSFYVVVVVTFSAKSLSVALSASSTEAKSASFETSVLTTEMNFVLAVCAEEKREVCAEEKQDLENDQSRSGLLRAKYDVDGKNGSQERVHMLVEIGNLSAGSYGKTQKLQARNGLFTPLELNWRKAEFRPYKAKILDLVQTKETGKEPDRLETFEDTYTRKKGTYVNGYNATLIEKAYTLRQEGSFDNEQIFQKVHGPEHPGRVRCAGLGPTPSTYLGPSCSSASINSTTTSNSNEVDALKSEVIELRNELAKAKSEVVELRSGMDQLQLEVDTLKTLSLQHIRREKGSMEGSIRAPSSSSQSATRG
ncbi:unnamed protein product [Linum tenue]|uniref:Uncharacterized protein n=1 Tax=Linum tenue TaxID=586396 RepID=A0AAV0IY86_9ROSI|nr:unnamed protein product [Linum tenue]